jgi:hypothetical protein
MDYGRRTAIIPHGRRTAVVPLKVGLSLRSRTGQQTARQQSRTGDGGNLLDCHILSISDKRFEDWCPRL